MIFCASARVPRLEIQPAPETFCVRVSKVFSAKLSEGTAPRPKRSSGTKCSPAARRCFGDCAAMSRPCKVMLLAAARGSSPDSARSSSCCPLPDTPATPKISPARTSKLMLLSSVPKGSSVLSDRSRTSSTTSPTTTARCTSAGGSAPIMRRERLALLSCRGSTSPITLPPRSTVQRVHSARISSSLWLM